MKSWHRWPLGLQDELILLALVVLGFEDAKLLFKLMLCCM